ncbi:MAG: hypothetical protein HOQ09_02235 [Gemmatimonadaceae bacterium]|nr:hypothetical protein [Gemmatimonadaceae bacterium]
MKFRSGVAIAGLLVGAWAAPLRAQNGTGALDPQCAGGSSTFQDVCQKATDLYRQLAPQLGAVVAGGNATLGQGTPLGLGRWTVGLRFHVIDGSVPDLSQFPADTGAAKRTRFPLQEIPLPLPMVDGAVGVLPSLPFAGFSVGGLDALVNVAYLPNVARGGVTVRVPNGPLKLGYGARLGIFDAPGPWPALSATWIRRDLPVVHAAAAFAANSDRVEVEGLRARTTAWRLVASSSFGPLQLDAGGGQDRASSEMNLYVAIQPPRCTYGPQSCSGRPFDGFAQKVTRSQLFADASVDMRWATLTFEVGRVGAIAIPTFNEFVGGSAGDASWEGALGIRVGTGR